MTIRDLRLERKATVKYLWKYKKSFPPRATPYWMFGLFGTRKAYAREPARDSSPGSYPLTVTYDLAFDQARTKGEQRRGKNWRKSISPSSETHDAEFPASRADKPLFILTKAVPELFEFRPADWSDWNFSGQSAGRNSTTSGTGFGKNNADIAWFQTEKD